MAVPRLVAGVDGREVDRRGDRRAKRVLARDDRDRYPFAEVAEITGRTPAACRQLASSARRRIQTAQAPAAPGAPGASGAPPARHAGIVREFKQAWEAKDVNALIGLLDPDATMVSDGGGLATAALRPTEGAEQIARYLVGLAAGAAGLTILERTVNG